MRTRRGRATIPLLPMWCGYCEAWDGRLGRSLQKHRNWACTWRRRVLKEHYRHLFAQLEQQDPKFRFIDPDECSIRNSRMLFYWGHHLFTGEPGKLAFTAVGGRCVPKEDFLNLLDYLERLIDLGRHKPTGAL